MMDELEAPVRFVGIDEEFVFDVRHAWRRVLSRPLESHLNGADLEVVQLRGP